MIAPREAHRLGPRAYLSKPAIPNSARCVSLPLNLVYCETDRFNKAPRGPALYYRRYSCAGFITGENICSEYLRLSSALKGGLIAYEWIHLRERGITSAWLSEELASASAINDSRVSLMRNAPMTREIGCERLLPANNG